MVFVCYTDWKQLPASADKLFSHAAKTSVFFSSPWYRNLLAHQANDFQGILLACVVEDDAVLAILPLMMRSDAHWYTFANLYTSLGSVLVAQDRQEAILTCLAQGLAAMPFASIRVDPVADDDDNVHGFQQAMEAAGIACQRRFRFYNWVHYTQGQCFDEYMAARPARLRNTISRKARKLEREQGYTVRIHTDEGLQQAIADYHAVYQSSWKANELYSDFINGLAASLSAAGWLRLGVLYVKERPIAAQFWFVVHGKANIFKLAYDEQWRDYSPGSILTARMMQQVIDNDKVTEIDFLTGNDAYKRDWMSVRRERYALHCINSPKTAQGIFRLRTWLNNLLSR